MGEHERIRLVVLGGAGVGKSCIIRRFLANSYCDRYRSTVEDLYTRDYELGGGERVRLDILDTAGDHQFPAMRRLCIATAHAFLLVYAATSAPSFACLKRCVEEVREQRADFQEVPIVVAGNKFDLAASHREVRLDDVSEWLYCELPRLRVKLLECSAKDDINVREIFRSFMTLSRMNVSAAGDESGLKRRSSAYVSGKRRTRSPETSSTASAASSSTVEATTSANTLQEPKSKPRSRSLIRRSSRKAKQQVREAPTAPDDCAVS